MILDDGPDLDWTAPGVFRCAPGVHRIPLPLPNDGLRAVNVYAVADGDGITLVDSGWALVESRELLSTALAELDAGFGDVRRFLVTHVHRDHYTQAVVLRRDFGMRVALGRAEKPGLDVINADPGQDSHNLARLARAGADDLIRMLSATPRPATDLAEWTAPDDWIDDGAEIVVGDGPGGRRLRAIATPGHTRGHVVFADEAADLLFSGDHVLPRITPSIAFEPLPPPNPLADFLTSLDLMRSRPDAALLPAHGPIGMRVHERVDELIAHHAARLDASLAAVEEGRSTAYEVAGALPWTRRQTKLPDLDPLNAMLATLETASHLEVLVQRGVLARTEQDGVDHYATA